VASADLSRLPAVGPRLTLPETGRDLGPIRADGEAEFVFIFSNTGDRPLRVQRVDVLPATPDQCT